MYNSDGDFLIGEFCHMTSVSEMESSIACNVTLPFLSFLPLPTTPLLLFHSVPLLPPPPPTFHRSCCTVVQLGNLRLDTEFGKLEATPGEIVVIQVRRVRRSGGEEIETREEGSLEGERREI